MSLAFARQPTRVSAQAVRDNHMGRAHSAVRPSPSAPRPPSALPTRRDVRPLPASVATALGQPGRPLTAAEQAAAHALGNFDLAHVRILHGPLASLAAEDLDADAFTFAGKIGFAADSYRPGSKRGGDLLRHELVHVAQQRNAAGPPRGVAAYDSAAEREARGPDPLGATAAGDLVYCQARRVLGAQNVASPTPRSTEEVRNPGAPRAPDQNQPAPAPDLRTRVRNWLDQEHFDVPLVVDTTPPYHAAYVGLRWTLDQITDDTYEVLHQTDESVQRSNVWRQVWQYYQEKVAAIRPTSWNTSVQLLWTPTVTLASNQPIGSRLTNPLSLSVGRTYQAHRQGFGGVEHQLSLNGSFFDLGSGNTDWFQNALLQYQVAAVTPLGRDFRLLGGPWASAQASLYAQIGLGFGATWAAAPGANRQAFLGFLAQGGAGGQILITVRWFSLVVNGTVVYQYLGTPGSSLPAGVHTDTHTLGLQGGVGVQAQF